MPIYEYRCSACGHALEALQKISDAPLRKCPECKKSSLRRLVSAPSFRLKGGGWYETDFKSDSEKKRNLLESSDAGARDAPAAEAAKPDGRSKEPAKKEAAAGAEPKSKKQPSRDDSAKKTRAKQSSAGRAST
jgi:putative FmdB family regulatory protein